MTTHIKRIERVESELAQVVKTAAGKKDVDSLRAEYRKLIVSVTAVLEKVRVPLLMLSVQDGSHLDHLDLKAHLWGVGTYSMSSRVEYDPDRVVVGCRARRARPDEEGRYGSSHLRHRRRTQSASIKEIKFCTISCGPQASSPDSLCSALCCDSMGKY